MFKLFKINNDIKVYFSLFFLLLIFFLPVEEKNFQLHHDDDVRWIAGPLSKVQNISQYIDWLFYQVISKFRPITQFAYSVSWKLSSINHNFIYLINLIILSLSSFFIFKILFQGIKKDDHQDYFIFFLIVSIIFATSKYHYYGIYNLAGLKEILGTFVAILFLYKVTSGKLIKNNRKNFFILIIFYNLLVYIHEIWMAFIFFIPAILFYDLFIYKNKNQLSKFLFHSALSISIIIVFIILKKFNSDIVFVGLGHCPDILKDLDAGKIFNRTGYGFEELLGWIGGPTYLFGDDYEGAIKSWGKSRVPVYSIPLFIITFYIFFKNIKNNYRDPIFMALVSVMLISLIGAATVCRLEIRFLLPAFVVFFIIIFYPGFNNLKKTTFKILITLMLLQNLDYYMFGSNNLYYNTFYHDRPLIDIIKK